MPPVESSPPPVMLIAGDDDVAVRARAKEVYQSWTQEIGGFDHETIDGAAGNSGEALKAIAKLREAMQTLPFFGGGKVIWLQNCSFMAEDRTSSSAAVTAQLADLAGQLKEFTWGSIRLLITAPKVDKRKTLYKTLDKLGSTEFYEGWSADDREWTAKAEASIERHVAHLGKAIRPEAVGLLINFVGPNNRLMASETEKLVTHAGDKHTIESRDVEQITSRNRQTQAFALGDALGERNLAKAVKLLEEELWMMRGDSQKSGIGILYGFISKVRVMLLIKDLIRQGWLKADSAYGQVKPQLAAIPPEALPSDPKLNPAAMHPFVVFNTMAQARRYTEPELVEAMETLLNCNLSLVSSSGDEGRVLQSALLQIVKPAAPSTTGGRAG